MRKPLVVTFAISCLLGALTWGGGPLATAADSTEALQAKFNALKTGDTLTLDPGTYQYSDLLRIKVSDVKINGNGATLEATNPAKASLQILANDVSLSNLNLTAPAEQRRHDSTDRTRLLFGGDGVNISDVTITGGSSVGVYVVGASNFQIDRVTVRDTAADGVQMTGGSNNGVLNNVTTERTGDDGIAVVSYLFGWPPAKPCHDIVINSPVVNSTQQARGLVVVGGQRITFNDINVSETNGSGVFLGSQGFPFFTTATKDVKVNGGTITNGNVGPFPMGAVTVLSQNWWGPVNNLTVSDLSIVDTPRSAYANIGVGVWGGGLSNVAFNNIEIQQQPEMMVLWSNAPHTYTTSGFTMNGRPIDVP